MKDGDDTKCGCIGFCRECTYDKKQKEAAESKDATARLAALRDMWEKHRSFRCDCGLDTDRFEELLAHSLTPSEETRNG